MEEKTLKFGDIVFKMIADENIPVGAVIAVDPNTGMAVIARTAYSESMTKAPDIKASELTRFSPDGFSTYTTIPLIGS